MILEVVLALIVLVGAGLAWKSFDRVQSVDQGFRTDDLLTLRISLPRSNYPERGQQRAFFERLLEQVESLPQVVSVAAVMQLPLSGAQLGSLFQVQHEEEPFVANLQGVTPGYFQTLGIPLLNGRDFTSTDLGHTLPMAIIDETLAKTHRPDRNPVGEQIVWQRTGDVLEVMGVVGAVRHNGPEAPAQETLYRPSSQYFLEAMVLIAHTGDDPRRWPT